MELVKESRAQEKTDRRYLTGICGEANVRTPLGARRVEMLSPGDMVLTRNSGLQPVRLIWTWTATAEEIDAQPELAPIRFRPRAIGPMMPQRDLRIACGHRILVPGYRIEGVADHQNCLMRVDGFAAASDGAFADRSDTPITFYNVVFDQHEIITAEGLPIETFRPSPKSMDLMDVAARETLKGLFPELARRRCAYPGLPHPVAKPRAYRNDLS